MPGGNPEAWPHIKDILQGISAKVGEEPCCDWVGDSGAGHYVKMVHNGIEYGDMQLCCEAYDLMKNSLGMSCDDMSGVFREWNKGVLDSFLIEITADILGANSNAPCLHLYICGGHWPQPGLSCGRVARGACAGFNRKSWLATCGFR